MNVPKSILCALALGLSSAPGLFGQLLVFDYNDRGTWIGDGVTSKQVTVGKWIYCLCSNTFVKIELYPATKRFYVYEDSNTFFVVNAPKGKSHTILGWAKAEDPEENSFFSYSMLIGADKVSSIGGGHGNYSFPTSMTGPVFFTYLDPKEVLQGTQTLKFNSKETLFYNNNGIEHDDAAANQISKYQAAGNVWVD